MAGGTAAGSVVQGETFDARGIGVPGSPLMLVGFSHNVAWGMTALGADQADLFRLETDAAHPDQEAISGGQRPAAASPVGPAPGATRYRFDGQWRAMEVWTERILVKGGRAQQIRLRRTHLGPVVTELASPRRGDPEVALARIPGWEEGRDAVQASFAMLRARTAAEIGQALAGWRFPSVNVEPLEAAWVESVLAGAWSAAQARYGRQPEEWPQAARSEVARQELAYFGGLHGFPTLDAGRGLPLPRLATTDAATLRSQRGQSYTQFVPLHEADQALTLLPPGPTEDPAGPFYGCTLELWASGTYLCRVEAAQQSDERKVTLVRQDRRCWPDGLAPAPLPRGRDGGAGAAVPAVRTPSPPAHPGDRGDGALDRAVGPDLGRVPR
ncbi:MAG: penicillin acylase family protein [Candidatus Latescibacterota bacterium]